MNQKSFDYFYKCCDLDKKSSLERKKYEYLNEFGYNMGSNSRRVVDVDMKIKRHKNSDSE